MKDQSEVPEKELIQIFTWLGGSCAPVSGCGGCPGSASCGPTPDQLAQVIEQSLDNKAHVKFVDIADSRNLHGHEDAIEMIKTNGLSVLPIVKNNDKILFTGDITLGDLVQKLKDHLNL